MRINITLDDDTKAKARTLAKAWGFLGISTVIRHLIVRAWEDLTDKQKKL
jgi:antitoxin component of RelBE/YafQ-DinJ toxin-antitoxin module